MPLLTETRVTSSYGWRTDPITGVRTFHGGVDLKANYVPLYAFDDGVVSRVGDFGSTSYGKYLIIDHAHDVQTLCAHLSEINVVKGQKVKRALRTGRTGSTGRSTGPHLHFEIRVKGVRVDPMLFAQVKDIPVFVDGRELSGLYSHIDNKAYVELRAFAQELLGHSVGWGGDQASVTLKASADREAVKLAIQALEKLL